MDNSLLLSLAVSAAIGLLIGLQREQTIAKSPSKTGPAGMRTFPLIALAGSLLMLVGRGSDTLPAAGLLALMAILVVHRLGTPVEARDVGTTTEVAAMVTFSLGMLAVSSKLMANDEARLTLTASIGVVSALLLNLKPKMQALAEKISESDVFATLQLLVVALILLPILPNENYGPYGAINPAHTGRLVLLIGGVSYVGFVASRLLGAGRGLIVTGIAGGLASSTAVTFSMAKRAAAEPAVIASCAVATAAANAMSFARVILAVAVVHPPLVAPLAWPVGFLVVGGVVALFGPIKDARKAHVTGGDVTVSNPFDLKSAAVFGAMFSVVVLVVRAIQDTLGDAAIIIAGLIAGTTDVDAITLSTATLAKEGLSLTTAAGTILAAITANMIVKTGIAFVSGGRPFGVVMLRANALAVAAGVVGLIISLALH